MVFDSFVAEYLIDDDFEVDQSGLISQFAKRINLNFGSDYNDKRTVNNAVGLVFDRL